MCNENIILVGITNESLKVSHDSLFSQVITLTIEYLHLVVHAGILAISAYIVYRAFSEHKRFRGSILGVVWELVTPIVVVSVLISFMLSPAIVPLVPLNLLHLMESVSLLLMLAVIALILTRFSNLWYTITSRLSNSRRFNVPAVLSTLKKIFGSEGYTVSYYMGYWLSKGSKEIGNMHRVADRASNILGIPQTVVTRDNTIFVSAVISTGDVDVETLEVIKWHLKGYWEGALKELLGRNIPCTVTIEKSNSTHIITLKFQV